MQVRASIGHEEVQPSSIDISQFVYQTWTHNQKKTTLHSE